MGDPALADPTTIPDLQYNDTPGWAVVGGALDVKANYQLVVDNLLDLTHETFVHARTIGNAAVAETPMEAKLEGNEVHVRRIMPGTPAPPLFRRVRGLETIDRWQLIRFQPPSSVTIDARGYPAGSDDIAQGLRWFSINAITPLDARSCRYYWTITRCFDQDDTALSQLIHDQILATFLEDKEVLEAQQQLIETDERGIPEVSVRADLGAVAARRLVQRLIEEEAQSLGSARPAAPAVAA
jgi:vanillate O-demethylase monooxygenase subunit